MCVTKCYQVCNTNETLKMLIIIIIILLLQMLHNYKSKMRLERILGNISPNRIRLYTRA